MFIFFLIYCEKGTCIFFFFFFHCPGDRVQSRQRGCLLSSASREETSRGREGCAACIHPDCVTPGQGFRTSVTSQTPVP